jgi:hypothetical protein
MYDGLPHDMVDVSSGSALSKLSAELKELAKEDLDKDKNKNESKDTDDTGMDKNVAELEDTAA